MLWACPFIVMQGRSLTAQYQYHHLFISTTIYYLLFTMIWRKIEDGPVVMPFRFRFQYHAQKYHVIELMHSHLLYKLNLWPLIHEAICD